MNIHIFIHGEGETSALLESWIQEKGFTHREISLFKQHQLPAVEDIQALVLLGGPDSVHCPPSWMEEELSLVRECINLGKPVFGICLGSQIIASVLGAKVFPSGYLEHGWVPLEINPETLKYFPKLPATWEVFHFHGDTFHLPPGVHHWGSTEQTPQQGFFRPPNLMALQFHPETTPEEAVALYKTQSVVHPSEITGLEPYKQNKTLFYYLLDQWIQGIPTLEDCKDCAGLTAPLKIVNTLDTLNLEPQEFPDTFLNLYVPNHDLLLYYKNTERRLLKCGGCGTIYLYEQVKAPNEGLIQEILRPLNGNEIKKEIQKVRQEAQWQAQEYKTTYLSNLPRILAALDSLEVLEPQGR